MEKGSSSGVLSNQKGKSIMIENTGKAETNNDEHWPLSGKSYCDVILTKSGVKPRYTMYLPKQMNKHLPCGGAPVILTCGRKKWDLFYGGANSTYKFTSGWRKFADDNNLKEGDGLVFELSECSTTKIELRVQILQGDFPPELIPEDVEGKSSDNPIIID